MRSWFVTVVLSVTFANLALAQPALHGALNLPPTDLKKVPVGAWAEYSTIMGPTTLKSRTAYVARDSQSHTLETTVDGAGRKVAMKMVFPSNPQAAAINRMKQMVMQFGDSDPIEIPLEGADSSGQHAPKLDPKKLLGRTKIEVPAGTYHVDHYRDVSERGTTETWINSDVPPLGIIKLQITPRPGEKHASGQPMPGVTMELVAVGKNAKATITKPPKPFNPALLGAAAGGMSSGPSKNMTAR